MLVFILYLFTISPGMDFIDAGELSAVAHVFGISHPTGYPTFTLLAGLWSYLPLGSSIFRMNLFSAVLCSAAVTVFFHLLWFLFGLVERKTIPGSRKSRPKNGQLARHAAVPDDAMRLLLSAFGALMIGCSETFWSTALSIEVYALHMLLISIVLWCFMTSQFEAPADEVSKKRRWLLFAFTLGFSFTNHMTTILLLPAVVVLYFWRNRFTSAGWKRIGAAIPAFLLGLVPYLYLPLRAASDPILNWGNPQTLERLYWHMSGKQYRVWLFSSTAAAKKQMSYFLSTFPGEFAYLAVILILAGMIYTMYRNRKLGVTLLLLFFGCVLYSINYDIHDIDSYFLLAYIVAGIWSAFGLFALVRMLKQRVFLVALGTAALMVGLSIGMQWGAVTNNGNHLVDDYTSNMFRSLKPNALIISYQWDYWVSSSYHAQYVDGIRPDVVVIDKELLRRSWYLEQLKRNHPEIYRRSEQEIRRFLAEAYKFERDLPYQAEIIEQSYNDMINSFVDRNYADRPVYLTVEIENQFAADYQRIPEGLAYRIYRPADLPSPDAPVWDAFTFRPFQRSGRLIDGMLGMYATMLTNRGIWLYQQQRYQQSAPYFERALRFTPGNPTLLEWQKRVGSAMRMS